MARLGRSFPKRATILRQGAPSPNGSISAPPAAASGVAYFGSVSVSFTGSVAQATAAAPVGTATDASYVFGNVARATAAAPQGTTASAFPGNAAMATGQSYIGLQNVRMTGQVAAVTAVANLGTVGSSPPRIAPATATGASHIGHQNVSVASPGDTTTGVAYFGAVKVSVSLAPAHVAAVAPVGKPGSGSRGAVATASGAAVVGSVAVSAKFTARATGSALVGVVAVTAHGAVASVTGAAPTGKPGAGFNVTGGATGAALAGTVKVALSRTARAAGTASVGQAVPGVNVPGITALVSAGCPVGVPGPGFAPAVAANGNAKTIRGAPVVTVPGQAARAAASAPVSPFVAVVFGVQADATMEFNAHGSTREEVMVGSGVINTMNVED